MHSDIEIRSERKREREEMRKRIENFRFREGDW